MPKTIAITPSWYWPERTPRVSGTPPFSINQMLVERRARRAPDEPALADAARSVTGSELAASVAAVAGAIEARGSSRSPVRIVSNPGIEQAILFLGAMAAGCLIDATAAGSIAGGGLVLSGPGSQAGGLTYEEAIAAAPTRMAGPESLEAPALALDSLTEAGVAIGISQSAILARGISISTYFKMPPASPWLIGVSDTTWAWSATLAAALFAGSSAVIVTPGDADALSACAGTQASQSVGVLDFQDAFVATKEAKRAAKDLRGRLVALLLPVSASFDASERRRIEKMFDCQGLTVYGLPETGPVLASHPSWYLVESAGIPITNADVVPVDPRSGSRIQTLWELVEYASVNVRSPMLATSKSSNGSWEPIGGTVLTGMIASSDANGMIYLLPPGTV